MNAIPALLLLVCPQQGSSRIVLHEPFDEPGTSWAATIFPDLHVLAGGAFTREPLSVALGAPDALPELPINAGGDLEGRRAVGVTYRQGDRVVTARARREVIVSTGAIKTPQLLLLSGVGPAQQLASHGIPVVLDKHGVGENLQDHLQMILAYKLENIETMNEQYNSLLGKFGIALNYALYRRGPMSTGPSPLGIFLKSDTHKDRADLCYVILPFSRTGR